MCPCVILLLCLACSVEAKRNYRLELASLDIHKAKDYNLFTFRFAKYAKFNRTMNVFNMSGTLLQDLPPKTTTVELIAYEKVGCNRYSPFPIKICPTSNICHWMENDRLVLKSVRQYSNVPKTCPIKKGRIYIRDMPLDHPRLPDQLPGNAWKLAIKLFVERRLRFHADVEVVINRNV